MNFDPSPYLDQPEGQHYERKSLFHRDGGTVQEPRDRRTVRDQVAEYVAAFANAEGGVLILGIEDDGTLTGHDYADKALQLLLKTPGARLEPAQADGFVVDYEGVKLIVYEVSASDVAVQVTGDGFPLRMGDQTVQSSESKIQSLKLQGFAQSWEARRSALEINDLDGELVDRAKLGAGHESLSREEYLLKRKLADRRGAGISLRHAAELTFSKHGPDHPNAGVRIFRVIGTERLTGAEHNVEELPRIEGALPNVLSETYRTIEGLLRRPSRLSPGGKFQKMWEYPEFSWREAILNAVAHRDYGTQARCIEVWFFDDRMEVISPGALIPQVTVEKLLSLDRVHASRNPRLVRCLVDLGFMRDQGEGIPRMFAEMEAQFLPDPELSETEHQVSITLRNTMTLRPGDREFIDSLQNSALSPLEFRALLEAHRHGRVDNSRMRSVAGLDTLAASQVLRGLRDRELLTLHYAGGASYYTLPDEPSQGAASQKHSDTASLNDDAMKMNRGELAADRGELAADRGELAADRGELAADRGGLSRKEQEMLETLGRRPRKKKLRRAILQLTRRRELSARQIAGLLGRESNVEKLTERHLKPLIADGELRRTYPDEPTHPDQKYYAAPLEPGPLFERREQTKDD